MSSTNDTYHHLLVQSQPKSILKKSPSPRFFDSSINSESTILSSPYGNERTDINNQESIHNTETSLTQPFMTSTEMDSQLIHRDPLPPDDSLSSLTSDDDQEKPRIRKKAKKNSSRLIINNRRLSSPESLTDDNNYDERKAKRSSEKSKSTFIHSTKQRQNDMQLDEFMRKYQQQGGIPLIPPKDQSHQGLLNNQQDNDDTIHYLDSLDKITLTEKSQPPLQYLFDIIRQKDVDRRLKIDQIRQYIEEQIGITQFLTIYKLIKSSQIPINIHHKPFCYYANFIPHLCCLIMLESEEQKYRF